VGTCVIICKESGALQSGVNGIGLIAGCQYWNGPFHNGVHPQEAEIVGNGTWWLLSIHSLLLCSVLLGLHWVDHQIHQPKCLHCGTLYSPCFGFGLRTIYKLWADYLKESEETRQI
jgi:hypothetical protein